MGSQAWEAKKVPGEETDERGPVVGGSGIREKLKKLRTILQEQRRGEAQVETITQCQTHEDRRATGVDASAP
jgi:hypothetical protein